jgi:hypothetical protein
MNWHQYLNDFASKFIPLKKISEQPLRDFTRYSRSNALSRAYRWLAKIVSRT